MLSARLGRWLLCALSMMLVACGPSAAERGTATAEVAADLTALAALPGTTALPPALMTRRAAGAASGSDAAYPGRDLDSGGDRQSVGSADAGDGAYPGPDAYPGSDAYPGPEGGAGAAAWRRGFYFPRIEQGQPPAPSPTPTPAWPAGLDAAALDALGLPEADIAARRALLAGAEGYGASATGGLAGPLILVSSLADAGPGSLREALERPGPAWVAFAVDGQIRLRSPIELASDKTVDGRGHRIEIVGRGLDISRANNVVVSHLILHRGKGDAISVRHESRGVWLNHLTLVDFDDGLVDVTHGATDVTLSWSSLQDHVKGVLLGAHDWDASAAVIRVTLHHNHFRSVQRRLPKLRYGRAHSYNNLIELWRGPAVEVGFGGQIRLEGNVFVPDPKKSKAISAPEEDGPGLAGGGGNWTGGFEWQPEPVFEPDYAYGLETPSEELVERLRTQSGWQPVPWPFGQTGAPSD